MMDHFIEIALKSEPEPGAASESVRSCRLCLASQSAALLTWRDLAPFYCVFRPCGLGRDTMDSAHYSWVCQYCWVRACQCLKFIECVRRTELALNMLSESEPTEEKLQKNNIEFTPPVHLSIQRIEQAFINITPAPSTDRDRLINAEREFSDYDDLMDFDTDKVLKPKLKAEREIAERKAILKREWDASVAAGPGEPCFEDVKVAWDSCVTQLGEASGQASGVKKNPLKLVERKRRAAKKKDRPWKKYPKRLLAMWKSLNMELVNLSEEEQRAELAERRGTERYASWEHKCIPCAVGFHERDCFDKHMRNHEESRGPNKCHICGIRFPTDSQLISHLGGHRRRWRCLRCKEMVTKNHLMGHHAKCSGSAPVCCEQCGKMFNNKLRLRVHVSKAHTRKRAYKCEVCAKQFTEKTHMKYHMRSHTGETPYECNICGKKSSTPNIHRLHMKVHESEKQDPELYCVECNKYFKNKSILKSHFQKSLKHTTRDTYQYVCTDCNERFPTQTALTTHVNTSHLNVRSHQCPLCDKAYYTRGALTAHTKEKHSGREHTKDHKCNVCGRAFATRSQMRSHLAIHTNERNYVCPLCPSTFNFYSALYTHCKLKHHTLPADIRKSGARQ